MASLTENKKLILNYFIPLSLLIGIILILVVIYLTPLNPSKNANKNDANPDATVQAVGDQTFTNGVNQGYKNNPELQIIAELPYTDPANNFSVMYSATNDTFYVHFIGVNKTKDKQLSDSWFSKFNIPLTQLKIYYD